MATAALNPPAGRQEYRIPFNRPGVTHRELANIADAIARGHSSANGYYTALCQRFLERLLPCSRSLLTTSCTDALEMCALLLNIQPGDEVIVPSFTFVSTAAAFALFGAKPVFVDIHPDTLNLDERILEEKITPRTRAIVPVHYAGVACEMDAIMAIAARHGITVIEDNAHGLFGSYRGKLLGTFGQFATQSFHETKNVHCGEGGSLVINDPRYIERAEMIREKGTNRNSFHRGEVDKYTWVELGSSYSLSDLAAAFLWAQLEDYETIQKARSRIWETYAAQLADWAESSGVTLPHIPSHTGQSYHMFYIRLPSLSARSALIGHLNSRGIHSVFHYAPLHLSSMGLEYGGFPGMCPVAENVADRLLRLPFYNDLTADDQGEVLEAVRQFHF